MFKHVFFFTSNSAISPSSINEHRYESIDNGSVQVNTSSQRLNTSKYFQYINLYINLFIQLRLHDTCHYFVLACSGFRAARIMNNNILLVFKRRTFATK